MMKSFLTLIVFTGLFFVSSAGVQAETYKFGVVGDWLPWGTAYVAAEKGFWKEAGVDIKIRRFVSYPDSLKSFQHGHTDFGIMMIGDAVEIITNTSGKQVILYEHDWSHGGDWFVVSNDIETVADLKGKAIGVNTKSAPYSFLLQKMLATASLNLEDVSVIEIVHHENLSAAFKRGKLSAMVNVEPAAAGVVAEKAGKLMFTSADFEGLIPEGLAAKRALLEEHPEVVKKFMYGWLKAVQWQTNPENFAEWRDILGRTTLSRLSPSNEEFKKLLDGVRIHDNLSTINARNQDDLPKYVKALLEYLAKISTTTPPNSPDTYINTGPALEVARDVFK